MKEKEFSIKETSEDGAICETIIYNEHGNVSYLKIDGDNGVFHWAGRLETIPDEEIKRRIKYLMETRKAEKVKHYETRTVQIPSGPDCLRDNLKPCIMAKYAKHLDAYNCRLYGRLLKGGNFPQKCAECVNARENKV